MLLRIALVGSALLWLRNRRGRLRGKTAVVTGASRGLGLELARELVRRGAQVAICARDENALEQARIDLASRGGQVLARRCDVRNREEVHHFLRAVTERFGDIDVVINNAGLIQVGPASEMTLEDFEEAMRTHFFGPLYLTWSVLPRMRARRYGRIVNISSIGGKIPAPHLLPYVASKFALTGFSEGLSAELARDGVHVTTVIPGLMRTGSPPNAWFKGQHRREYAWFKLLDSLPLLSSSSPRAARKIVNALARGRKEVLLTPQAKVSSRLFALFPAIGTRLLGWVNRGLPRPGGIREQRARGWQSESAFSRSWMNALTKRAALRNAERPG